MKTSLIKYSIPALLLLSATAVNATTIKEVVQHTLVNNPQIQSSMKNDEAFKLYVDEARGGYTPQVDLTAELTKKRTKTDPDNTTASNTNNYTDGHNLRLDIEQLLYDGGLTDGLVDEATYKGTSNKFANDTIRNEVLLEAVSSYLNMVKYEERMKLSQDNLNTHEGYLKTAKETEEINGEALDRVQTSAKIYLAKSNYLEEKANNKKAISTFEKNVGMSPEGKSCRPNINTSKVSEDLALLVKDALAQNSDILEQVENIKEQREVVNQTSAAFIPTLKFKAQAIEDKDLITNDTETRVYTGKIELTYNIWSGGSDQAVKDREKLFLMESQQTLDTVTKSVTDKLTSSYITYQTAQEKIIELERYIEDNKQIVLIYQDQFEAGTRTFIDVLNVEGDLYNSRLSLVNAQFDLYQSYYEIMTYLSMIQDNVMSANDQVCTDTPMPKKVMVKSDDSEMKAMMSEGAAGGTLIEDIAAEFASEIDGEKVILNKETGMFRINELATPAGYVFHDSYNEKINDYFPRLVKVLVNHKADVDEVKVVGHASTDYKGATTVTDKFIKNKTLSVKRANSMISKGLSIKDPIIQDNLAWLKEIFKPYGKSSSEIIKNADGTENVRASRRVEFVIVSK